MHCKHLIKTQLSDRIPRLEERGERHWRAAELSRDVWFVVEQWWLNDGERTFRSWFTPSVYECRRLLGTPDAIRSRVFAYIRAPLLSVQGFLFEEVIEAHSVSLRDEVVLRFASGVSVVLPASGQEDSTGKSHPQELQLVFSTKGIRKPSAETLTPDAA